MVSWCALTAVLLGVWPAELSRDASGENHRPKTSEQVAREQSRQSILRWETTYTGEALGNLTGGRDRGWEYLDLATLTIEGEGLPSDRTRFRFTMSGSHGGSISDNVGDCQGISNIEASPGWRPMEAWLETEFQDGSASVLGGLYDVNSEFDLLEVSTLFLNGSHGIGATLGMSGPAGPSIFPFTALGLRVQVSKADFYFRGAIVDSIPLFGRSEKHLSGFLAIAEAGFRRGSPSGGFRKTAFGAWSYSGRLPDHGKEGEVRSGRPGFYALHERDLGRYLGNRQFAFFIRGGLADGDTNQMSAFWGAGLVVSNVFARQRSDELGFSIASARNGRPHMRSQAVIGHYSESHETVLEVSYRLTVASWISIQPDLQYVFNPGTLSHIENAVVVGIRFELSL